MPDSHDTLIRVRYVETDRMGYLHHAHYITYYEQARTELIRQHTGVSYRDMEDAGFFLVVADFTCKYRKPARYDDLLTVRTTVEKVTRVRIVHRYHVFRDGELLAEAHSTLACVDRDGRVQQLPPALRGGAD
jgi:acyl-CoA thioester hydrolase